MSPILSIHSISKSFPTKAHALRDINFEINAGEILGLIGPNGSGKTTLINCITGLCQPTKGNITWQKGVQANIFIIPDRNLLPELLTGREYLGFLVQFYNKNPHPKTASIVEVLNMTADLDKPIADYSYGMKKKIQFIAGIALQPNLLILDEPFRGLDIESISIAKKLLKYYAKQGGAVLLSSHDILLVEQICSQILIIFAGETKALNSPEELLSEFNEANLEDLFMKLTRRNTNADLEEILSH